MREQIARERKYAYHVLTNARAFRPSLVALCWKFLRANHGKGM
jgi:hypothetical protein